MELTIILFLPLDKKKEWLSNFKVPDVAQVASSQAVWRGRVWSQIAGVKSNKFCPFRIYLYMGKSSCPVSQFLVVIGSTS